ncbi:MAG: SDR family oxidoreductase [Cytophagales bacterium]|nr:SDR family oxidoreductase [Cytophagales bacterium]MDW8385321.1 SDR family oxidoreductase [Flammeovirgaceae bacterium]
MDLNLTDKVALVTGGASGIGEAIVRGFAREGAKVMIVGRGKERAAIIINSIGKPSYVQYVEAELTRDEDCQKAVSETLRTFGKIDIVVNNAGVNDKKGIGEASPSEFMESIYKNLFHYYAIAHYALEALKATKGTIINIGSKVADRGQGGTSGYAASKGGIHALTREWAADLCKFGIRVNEVVPAETWTPLYETWIRTFPNPEEKLASITKNIPLGKRMTTSEEIANMVLFLASDKSSHTTGQIIFVDGGYTHLDRALTV